MSLIKKTITARVQRNFSFGSGLIFAVLSIYFFYKTYFVISYSCFGISLVFLLIGMVMPALILPIYKVWMGFAQILGVMNTRIILFLVFMLVIIPIGMILKLLKKDILDIRIDKDSSTYWNKREQIIIDGKNYERHY